MNWQEFFAMGGDAFYVWTAYGITALAIGWEVANLRLRTRQQRRLSDGRND